ncbi:hypothetical protein FAVG1_00321 [Fusarium avenaceum]|nr:hypothetical protein FAVG1_00321 [Fusarium avenaceum]
MTSSDIRKRYDYERDDAEIVASILDTCPPLWDGYKRTPGIDCLITVIRRIYSHTMLGPGVSASLGWIQKSEADNPILGHAWHMFGHKADEVNRASLDRKGVHAKLLSKGFNGSSTFGELSGSSLMSETFWSKAEFRLTQIPFCINEGCVIDQTPDEIADMSLLRFDRRNNPDLSLQEVVDNAFGIFPYKGRDVCFTPNQPWIIRVLYQPHPVREVRWPLCEKNTIQLPIWDEVEGKSTVCFEEVDRSEYCLLAVVRMKNDDKLDNVRTYCCSGANVIGRYEPQSFMSAKWSATEPTAEYMLFFGLRTNDIGLEDPDDFPEVAEGPKVNEELVSGVHAVLQAERAKLREAREHQDVGQSAPNMDKETQPQDAQPQLQGTSELEVPVRQRLAPVPTYDEAMQSERRGKKGNKGKSRSNTVAKHRSGQQGSKRSQQRDHYSPHRDA